MKRIISVLFAFFMVSAIFAQSNEGDWLKRRAAERVGQLCDYIEFIANPQNDYDTRNYYKTKALNLFINKGEEYEEDGVYKKGVIMEVSSIYRSKPSVRLMKDYFRGLMNMRYSKVIIESTEVSEIEVSKLQQIGEDTYVCTCFFEQAFCGYKDGIPVYKDITRKKVKCYIIREMVEGDDGDIEYEHIIRLGDVTALETRRVS